MLKMKRRTAAFFSFTTGCFAVVLAMSTVTSVQAAEIKFTIVVPGGEDLKSLIDPFVKAAQETYPILLKHFENPDKPAPRDVKIIFKTGIKPPAFAQGDVLTVNLDWIRKEPGDLGMMTHELTHLVQDYPSFEPGWLTEGIADYARALYAKNDRKSWSLPAAVTAGQSYKQGYGVSAAFLVWLEQRKAGIVDQLHRAMQKNSFTDVTFKAITGADVDSLWTEYAKSSSPTKP